MRQPHANFSSTHEVVYEVIEPALNKFFGTRHPRFHRVLTAVEVQWNSQEGEALRARIAEHTPMFLARLGLTPEICDEDTWGHLVTWVEAGCLDGGLEILPDGELAKAETIIHYADPNDFGREWGILFRLHESWDCQPVHRMSRMFRPTAPRLDSLGTADRRAVIGWYCDALAGAFEPQVIDELPPDEACIRLIRCIIVTRLLPDLSRLNITFIPKSRWPEVHLGPAVFIDGVCMN